MILAFENRRHPLAAAHAENIGGHRIELDTGILQHLVNPVVNTIVFFDQLHTVTRQIPSVARLARAVRSGRSSPCARNSAIHGLSRASVLRPGLVLI